MGRPRDHKRWDGNEGIPAQHNPVNGSREIGRGGGDTGSIVNS